MGNLFITSDQHFFHKNILKYQSNERPFDTMKEMNEAIIERHNEIVKPDDEIWYLGDFAFAKEHQTLDMLSQLNGKKYFIFGNHDKVMHNSSVRDHFEWMGKYKEIKVGKRTVVLFHFPIEHWNKETYGSFHLHGHCHSTSTPTTRKFDIGVDGNDLYPHSVEEVIYKLKKIEKFNKHH